MELKDIFAILGVSALAYIWWFIKGKESEKALKENLEVGKKLLEKDSEIGKLRLKQELFDLKEKLEEEEKQRRKTKPVDPSDFN